MPERVQLRRDELRAKAERAAIYDTLPPISSADLVALLDHIDALEAALRPFVGAYEGAREAYRKRGGNPDLVSRAPFFDIVPSQLFRGKPRVPPYLAVLTTQEPYRRAAAVLANQPLEGPRDG